ncbi:MAG TPA: hypothetical protein VLB84_07170 [Bacteroidia bacterium]|jgi:hypothetical protein|nr:hypothetical protein [Bacteroidia bacterium]
MKSLLLSSILAIVICSCSKVHYQKATPLFSSAEIPVLKPIFGDHFNSFLFKTNLTAYGKDFSGLLLLKQMQPDDYRVIFTTELGMKLVDFEFTDTAFTLHYCVPYFNRPALLKILQQDIHILLMNTIGSKKTELFTNKQHQQVIKQWDTPPFFNFYSLNQYQQIVAIEHTKKQIKKTTFVLGNYNDDIPGNITIQHHTVKLRIELALLKK